MDASGKKSYHHGDLKPVLLRAAETELANTGLESFSLRRVAKLAGVTPAAPAHHFGNTDGLLTALAVLGFERMLSLQKDRQLLTPTDPEAKFVASGIAYVDFAVAHPTLFQLMFNSQKLNETDDMLNVARLSAYQHLVSNVRDLNNTGTRNQADVMVDAMAAWVTVHGLASLISVGKTNRLSALEAIAGTDRNTLLTRIILNSIGSADHPT